MITMYSKNGIMPRALGSLIEDVFNNGVNKMWGEENLASVPVNIRETDKSYELHVVAPGLKKEEFKVGVDRNILTVSFDHKEKEEETGEQAAARWLRSEYKAKSFKRSFTLNEKVDTSGITARYTDGILEVSIPKKEQQEVTAQQISVS